MNAGSRANRRVEDAATRSSATPFDDSERATRPDDNSRAREPRLVMRNAGSFRRDEFVDNVLFNVQPDILGD